MAEGGHSPDRSPGTESTEETPTAAVRGDQVETIHKVAANQIGIMTVSPGPNVLVEEANIPEDVQQINLDQVSTPGIATDASRQTSAEEKSAMSEEKRRMKIGFLKERCNALLGQSDYLKASSILGKICSLQQTKNFGISLQMAECYLYLGREKKADQALQTVTDIIVTSQLFTARDVYNLGRELLDNSSHIRAIILLRIASDMYETSVLSPDDVIICIFSCIDKIDDAVALMIKAGERAHIPALDYGIEFMEQMLQKIQIVKNANLDNKALKEAMSMCLIGCNLLNAAEYEKSLEICQTGVKVLEQQFGLNSSKYATYGNLFHNIGTDLYNTNNSYSEAESYLVKALEAYEKAIDWEDESKKQRDIELSKNSLKRVRADLANERQSTTLAAVQNRKYCIYL